MSQSEAVIASVVESRDLPDELLVRIGFMASRWAHLEQEMLLHASAMAALKSGGRTEKLRLDFTRLRRRWYELAKERADPLLSRELELLNDRLARRSEARGYAIHDVWGVLGAKQYRVRWYEQREKPEVFRIETTEAQLDEQISHLCAVHRDLLNFMVRLGPAPGTVPF